MVVLGALSGIQDFVFAPSEEEAGQARVLRARSFFVQGLTEVLALTVQRALGVSRDRVVFCAAGKFALEATEVPDDATDRLERLRRDVERWLLQKTGGALRFALAAAGTPDASEGAAALYQRATAVLAREKARAWAHYGVVAGSWKPSHLVLRPEPIAVQASVFRDIGRVLPKARWFAVFDEDETTQSRSAGVSFDLCGYCATLADSLSATDIATAILVADLSGAPGTGTNRIERPLSRHVPLAPDGVPILFEDLARRARGSPLLGVLKMDVDSLGTTFSARLRAGEGMSQVAHLSAALDRFFGVQLDRRVRLAEWQSMYTVFSGGDDLLMVGPWDVAMDFAGDAERLFREHFGNEALTISAALLTTPYRYPIRHAAAQAGDLLLEAKHVPAEGESAPRDQMAALGQIWKWKDHRAVVERGKELAAWVENAKARRGWLHTMLRFVEEQRAAAAADRRDGSTPAGARLAYHVARNFPKADDPDPDRRALRQWADHVVAGLGGPAQGGDPDVRYVPAILRYALLATRPREGGDRA